jgi:hypothetical protein
MHQLLPHLSPLSADLIAVLSIMAGSVLLVGAFVLPRPKRKIPPTTNATVLPSLRNERILLVTKPRKFALKTFHDG